MNLNAIVVFTKVVQAGSFRAAARELGIPKSTVSRRVAELEEELGARLLQRTTRKLHLTDVGSTYFEYCTRIVAEVEEATAAVTKLQAAPRGLLRVSTPLNFSVVGPIVTEYLKRYPETRIEMVCTDQVIDLVDQGIDLAIRVGQLSDSTLISRKLGGGRTRIVASDAYLARRGRPESADELANHDGLVFGAGPGRNRWTLRSGGRATTVTVPPRVVVNDFNILRDAALRGLGIAMLPEELCLDHIRMGTLRHLLPDWHPPEVKLQAVYPSTRHLSPKVIAFLDLLREQFGSPEPPAGVNAAPSAPGPRRTPA